jgi:hypothetical protein
VTGCGRKPGDDIPAFADYESRTNRQIPVLVLERAA